MDEEHAVGAQLGEVDRLLLPVRAEGLHRQSDGPHAYTLRKASSLASSLNCRINLVVPQVVPFPLPLASPPVLLDWNEKRFRVIAGTSPVETTVQIYLCRDRVHTLLKALAPRSLVVVGDRKRWWWPTPEKRLARELRRAGHKVILTETE